MYAGHTVLDNPINMTTLLVDHEYHGVEIVKMPSELWDWLVDRFGVGDGTVWFYRCPGLYFAKESDHLMFLLQWGSE